MTGSRARVPPNFTLVQATVSSRSAHRLAGESVSSVVSDDEVRNEAYRLYERRGRAEGHAVEDWLTAEHDLRARKNRANKMIFR